MGKSTPQTATTTQQTNMGPWKPQQPYLTKAFGEAESLYDNYSPEYFKAAPSLAPRLTSLRAGTRLRSSRDRVIRSFPLRRA